MSVVPPLLADRFQLQQVLGQDAVSEVWLARDLQLGQPVAVRMLAPSALGDPAALQRLRHDTRAVAALAHPNIVAIHGASLDPGLAYEVLELVDGTTLDSLIASGPLPVDQAVNIAGQICAALAAAHAVGVFHRDLGPDNVVVRADGTVKVDGFGIAHLSTDTPADPRTDLYAVGWLLHVLLFGGPPPIDGPGTATAVRSNRPDVSPELAALLGQLLAANPANPGGPMVGADEVGRRLLSYAPQAAVPDATAARPARHSRAAEGLGRWRRPAVLVAVAVGTLIAVVTGVLIAGGRDPVATAPDAATPAATSEPAVEPTATPDTSPSPSPSPTPTPSRSPASRTAELIAALRDRLPRLVSDGQVSARAAGELDRRLGDAAQALAANQRDTAWSTLQAAADRVVKLHTQHKITDAGYDILRAAFAQLAESLPPRQ
jgi:serine/threonine protein kinase